jgi:outer membrane protein
MNFQSIAIWVAAAASLAAGARGQTPAPAATPPAAAAAAPVKIATIHVQNAIIGTKDGLKASQDLQTKFDPRRQVLEKQQSEIGALQQQMRAGAATMSQASKDKLMRDIDAKNNALKRAREDYDAEVQQEQGTIMNDLGQKMMEIIGKYCAQNGIALVVDISNPQSPVLWADPSLDITSEIVKQYDQAHPVAAPPAAAPVAPPAPKKQ